MPKTRPSLSPERATDGSPRRSATTAPVPTRRELDALVLRALAIADALQLWDVGISLDAARIDLERLAGVPAEHATAQ